MEGESSLIGAHRIDTLEEIAVALVYPGAVKVSLWPLRLQSSTSSRSLRSKKRINCFVTSGLLRVCATNANRAVLCFGELDT
jgi:hypothetical protein